MKTINKISIISVLTVGLVVAACAEKSSKAKKDQEKSGVTEFVTEQVDLTPPQKIAAQVELTAEEMNEAKEIYSFIKLTTDSKNKIHNYIQFKNDSDFEKSQKEKKLSQASPELKNLIKLVEEKCKISSAELDQTDAIIENSISGENCPINEKVQKTKLVKVIYSEGKPQQHSQLSRTFSYNEELNYNTDDVVAITKIKSLKGSIAGTIKISAANTGKQRKSYTQGGGKIEAVFSGDKPLLMNMKIQSSSSYNTNNEIVDSRDEAKVSLSTNKEAIITVIKKTINAVIVSKKVYINDKEIESEVAKN